MEQATSKSPGDSNPTDIWDEVQRTKTWPGLAPADDEVPKTHSIQTMEESMRRTNLFPVLTLVTTLAVAPMTGWTKTSEPRRYYCVFDNITYKVEGDRVELSGQVHRPTLKSSAARVVQQIEGVKSVTNNIEVLPLSPNDDRIRLGVYRAIYGSSALSRYALQPVPPIHIIVRNGQVTLEGVAANEMDKNIANIQAHSVPGVFSIAQNISVEKQ
jgi:BON domain-containing protein